MQWTGRDVIEATVELMFAEHKALTMVISSHIGQLLSVLIKQLNFLSQKWFRIARLYK
jgi:hypothetical protein